MTTETKIKRITAVLEEVGHIPGEVEPSHDGTAWEIEIPIVLSFPVKVTGGTTIRLKGENKDELVEEALSLVELLSGLDPDERHGFPDEEEPKEEIRLKGTNPPGPIRYKAGEEPGSLEPVESFAMTVEERNLVLGLREGSLLGEIRREYLDKVVRWIDPGKDFAFYYANGELNQARERAKLAGLGESDQAAWLVSFTEFAHRASLSSVFVETAANAFRLILPKENWNPAEEINPAIAEGLRGKPSDSTLLLARLLSDLYLRKLEG